MNVYVPQRVEKESYSDYKGRRKLAKMAVKIVRKGKVFWDSGSSGTYYKEEDGNQENISNTKKS
jgi:hypothetical protein